MHSDNLGIESQGSWAVPTFSKEEPAVAKRILAEELDVYLRSMRLAKQASRDTQQSQVCTRDFHLTVIFTSFLWFFFSP